MELGLNVSLHLHITQEVEHILFSQMILISLIIKPILLK